MKKINGDAIINRCMIALSCNKRNDLAALLKISPQNLSGYIARGTFFNLVEPLLSETSGAPWTGSARRPRSQSPSIRTCFGTVLPRICWPATSTCARFSATWATPRAPQRKFTRTSRLTTCARRQIMLWGASMVADGGITTRSQHDY